MHAVTAGGAVARADGKFPAPAGRTGLVRPQDDRVFTMPSLTAVNAALANPECAMHDEYDTRERRQPSLAAARQCDLVKPKHGLHDASPLVPLPETKQAIRLVEEEELVSIMCRVRRNVCSQVQRGN